MRQGQESRILEHIEAHPWITATKLAYALKLKPSGVSGFLTKLTNAGVLVRKAGVGPLGGYGYDLKEKKPVPKTWHERLDDD